MKGAILAVIHEGITQGVKRGRACGLLQVSARRIQRWEVREDLVDGQAGPRQAPHRLLAEEQSAILEMARDERYLDDSHRVLAAKGNDQGIFAVSASTVYRVMRAVGLMTDRSGRSVRNGKSWKPERTDIDGPNQRWCWDISYLHTLLKGVFLYLYVLLDEYSRKVVSWRISWYLTHKEGQELIEDGLTHEQLSTDQANRLELYNDRGVQMKAKPFMRMLEDLGISQRFARPRTPNDNPYIESHFSIVKGDPQYPGVFADARAGWTHFSTYFDWYNNERLHGNIGYVTPAQKHRGEDKAILANRERSKKEARQNRLVFNRISWDSKLLTGGLVLA